MKTATRIDYAPIGKAERTPQGGLKIPAFMTRTGVFTYHDATTGKEVKEYRPPEEVFHADSMEMLRGAPLCLDHPPEPVNPNNFRSYSVGHVNDDVRKEGDKLGATLFIQDAMAVRSVEAGRRELSCGYTVDVDETPGVTAEGERYDRVQRNIRYNHLALVPDGRAGHDVRLRLDSSGNSIANTEEAMTEKVEVIGGVEYVAGTDAHRAAKERRDSAVKKHRGELETLRAERDAATARADAAVSKFNALRERIKQNLTQERIDSLVASRLRVVEKAREILGREFKADGVSNLDIKKAVIAKVFPDIRMDSTSRDYVNGLWRAAATAKRPAERKDSISAIPPHLLTPPPKTGGTTVGEIRKDAMEDQGQRAHRPLALSRRDTYKSLSSQPMIQGSQIEVMK